MLHSQFYLVDAEITLGTYEDGDIDGNGNVNGNGNWNVNWNLCSL